MSITHPSAERPTHDSVWNKGIWGWMFFDWAAQPFFTVVTTFIFGPYFISRMSDDPVAGQAAWGYGVAFAGIIIAILSPALGSIADKTGARKPWIGFFAIIKIISLSLLWYAEPGSSYVWVLLAFICASVAAEFSIVFNDSMMPRLIPASHIGRVSNFAWGLGYLAGMIVLIFVVTCLAASPETGKTLIGIEPFWHLDALKGEDARITGPIAALWYLIFILPMFIFTPDQEKGMGLKAAIGEGLAELKETLHEVRKKAALFRFLIARMIYQDGVNALLALGGGFAAAMFGWSITEIGLFGIILNVVAIFGCWFASYVDSWFGSKWVVVISLVLLLIATLGIVSTGPDYTLYGLVHFPPDSNTGLFSSGGEKAYLAFGMLIGIAFGPVQASSRSWFARSVEPHEAGRYFGIYALAGRATSFLAPFLVASMTAASGSPRLGIAVLVLFFVAGLYLAIKSPYPAKNPV